MHIVWDIYVVKLDIPLSFLRWIPDDGVWAFTFDCFAFIQSFRVSGMSDEQISSKERSDWAALDRMASVCSHNAARACHWGPSDTQASPARPASSWSSCKVGGMPESPGSLRRYMSLCIHCIHTQMYIPFVLSLIVMFCILRNDFGRLSDIIGPIMIVGWGIPLLPATVLCDQSLQQSHWISWISCGDFLYSKKVVRYCARHMKVGCMLLQTQIWDSQSCNWVVHVWWMGMDLK